MPTYIWVAFLAFIIAMILLDLGVFHRKAHAISIPEALGWTAFWFALAMVFNVLVYFMYSEGGLTRPDMALEHLTGKEAALKFFAGYLTEKSLSIDNIFVIAMIFAYFNVPLAEQHRVLLWGVIGAVIMRGIVIGAGVALVEKFSWMNYVFGLLLIASAARMLVMRHDNLDSDNNLMIRLVRKVYPVSKDFEGSKFFTRIDGRKAVTPLMLALVLVETSDLMFAVDSIPAIFAITRDPFLIWTSNVFAILGLRSLYFALAGLMDKFRYLKTSLVFLLVFIGFKLLIADFHEIPVTVTIFMIVGIIGFGILASVIASGRDTAALVSPLADQIQDLSALTMSQGRRVVTLIVGSTVLVLGAAMLVLPGPGLLTMGLGLAILAMQFVWARRWLVKVKLQLTHARDRLGRRLGSDDGDA